MKPNLTVIIPTRGEEERKLLRAVRSVVGPEAVVIVVFDGREPSPTTESELHELGVVVLKSASAGASAARNLGARHASTDWLAFIDDDDETNPGWLSFHGTDEPAEVAIRCSGAVRVSEEGAEIGRMVPTPLGPLYGEATGLFLAGAFSVRRELFEQVGGFDSAYEFGENNDLGMRLCRHVNSRMLRVETTSDPLVRIEVRPATQRRHTPEALLRSAELTLHSNSEVFNVHPSQGVGLHRIAAMNALKLGRRRIALEHMRKAVRHSSRPLPDALRLLLCVIPGAPLLARRSVDRRAKHLAL
ncbi:MAG: glycosyltransferase [Actinomycetes bacterium]|jgi:glycosyltransferase involved in cell wall biosynthesis|uniref:Unannotated protein n=1 Tax=freshwater metagenome TaxID=449393 RepID=A0A6J6EJM9_9ZZZZ|nr:glycosyltransferase [Actinomycetota bacterium]